MILWMIDLTDCCVLGCDVICLSDMFFFVKTVTLPLSLRLMMCWSDEFFDSDLSAVWSVIFLWLTDLCFLWTFVLDLFFYGLDDSEADCPDWWPICWWLTLTDLYVFMWLDPHAVDIACWIYVLWFLLFDYNLIWTVFFICIVKGFRLMMANLDNWGIVFRCMSVLCWWFDWIYDCLLLMCLMFWHMILDILLCFAFDCLMIWLAWWPWWWPVTVWLTWFACFGILWIWCLICLFVILRYLPSFLMWVIIVSFEHDYTRIWN